MHCSPNHIPSTVPHTPSHLNMKCYGIDLTTHLVNFSVHMICGRLAGAGRVHLLWPPPTARLRFITLEMETDLDGLNIDFGQKRVPCASVTQCSFVRHYSINKVPGKDTRTKILRLQHSNSLWQTNTLTCVYVGVSKRSFTKPNHYNAQRVNGVGLNGSL